MRYVKDNTVRLSTPSAMRGRLSIAPYWYGEDWLERRPRLVESIPNRLFRQARRRPGRSRRMRMKLPVARAASELPQAT